MPTLKDLAARMALWQVNLPVAASNLVINAAGYIEEELVLTTPVDTSKALSNWVASIDEIANTELEAISPGSHGSTQGTSADEAYQAALSVIATKQPGEVVYLTNNAPYILDLNDGTSTQAPSGFIESSALVAFSNIANTRIKLDG